MRCIGALKNANLTFNFTLTCRSPSLSGNYYTDYQLFLHQTITEHRERGLTFHAIANWMNKEGYLTVRGKQVRGAHIHSFNFKREIGKKRVIETRESPSLVGLQHGGG